MEKKRWLTWRKVAGLVFLMFLIDASCFMSWYAINNPPVEALEEGIRIGLAVDSTHYSGRHIKWGAEMAVDEINAEGGVDVGGVSMDLALVVEETEEMKPAVGVERTVSAVTKLISTHKVNVVMGGFATEMAALEVCARYKTIYMCLASSEDVVTEIVVADYEKYKYVFNLGVNSSTLGAAMVEFYTWLMDTYGFTRVAIIAEEYVWCDPIISYFEENKPDGMEVVYKVRFPSTTTTFMPFLTKAEEAGAQVIMPIIALDWGVTFIKEWTAMQVGLSAGLLVVAERSTFWDDTDGECKYHLEIGGGLPPSNATETTLHFVQGFKERYGEYPIYFAGEAYVAVYAYAAAVERAGTLESDVVVAALEKTDMITPSGILVWHKGSHSPHTEDIYGVNSFSQWMDSEYRPTIWANPERFEYNGWTSDPIAYDELELPPWRPSLK